MAVSLFHESVADSCSGRSHVIYAQNIAIVMPTTQSSPVASATRQAPEVPPAVSPAPRAEGDGADAGGDGRAGQPASGFAAALWKHHGSRLLSGQHSMQARHCAEGSETSVHRPKVITHHWGREPTRVGEHTHSSGSSTCEQPVSPARKHGGGGGGGGGGGYKKWARTPP